MNPTLPESMCLVKGRENVLTREQVADARPTASASIEEAARATLDGLPATINGPALSVSPDATPAEREAIGERLYDLQKRANATYRFLLGDWWNSLPKSYGAKANAAATLFGKDGEQRDRIIAFLRNCGWVANRWPAAQRSPKYGWSWYKANTPDGKSSANRLHSIKRPMPNTVETVHDADTDQDYLHLETVHAPEKALQRAMQPAAPGDGVSRSEKILGLNPDANDPQKICMTIRTNYGVMLVWFTVSALQQCGYSVLPLDMDSPPFSNSEAEGEPDALTEPLVPNQPTDVLRRGIIFKWQERDHVIRSVHCDYVEAVRLRDGYERHIDRHEALALINAQGVTK